MCGEAGKNWRWRRNQFLNRGPSSAALWAASWRARRRPLAHSTTATLPVRLHTERSAAEVEEADRLLFGGPPIEKLGRGQMALRRTAFR